MPSYAGDRIEHGRTDHEEGPPPIHRMSEHVNECHALSETLFLIDGRFHVRQLDIDVLLRFGCWFESRERLSRLIFFVLEQKPPR